MLYFFVDANSIVQKPNVTSCMPLPALQLRSQWDKGKHMKGYDSAHKVRLGATAISACQCLCTAAHLCG